MESNLNTAEAAKWLGLSARTLQDWRQEEIGPNYIEISPRCIRYAMEDLIKWRDERRRIPSVRAIAESVHAGR
jgi:Helix-turn-helix domain